MAEEAVMPQHVIVTDRGRWTLFMDIEIHDPRGRSASPLELAEWVTADDLAHAREALKAAVDDEI